MSHKDQLTFWPTNSCFKGLNGYPSNHKDSVIIQIAGLSIVARIDSSNSSIFQWWLGKPMVNPFRSSSCRIVLAVFEAVSIGIHCWAVGSWLKVHPNTWIHSRVGPHNRPVLCIAGNEATWFSGWWWLEPWNLMTFHILGIMIPTDEVIFFRGVGIPPSSFPSGGWQKGFLEQMWAGRSVYFRWEYVQSVIRNSSTNIGVVRQWSWLWPSPGRAIQSLKMCLFPSSKHHQICIYLVGGLEQFLCFHILGIIIPTA